MRQCSPVDFVALVAFVAFNANTTVTKQELGKCAAKAVVVKVAVAKVVVVDKLTNHEHGHLI
jgi:hypothetical protein